MARDGQRPASRLTRAESRARNSGTGRALSDEEGTGPRRIGLGGEDDDLALVAHAERVHGLRQVAPEHDRNAFALEDALDHERFGLVSTATHLDETGIGLGRDG